MVMSKQRFRGQLAVLRIEIHMYRTKPNDVENILCADAIVRLGRVTDAEPVNFGARGVFYQNHANNNLDQAWPILRGPGLGIRRTDRTLIVG